MPGEDLVLDADMGRITLELKKVQSEMRKTGNTWQKITAGANRDTKKNQDALKRLETRYGKAAAKAGEYKIQLDRLAKSSGNAAVRQKRLQSGMTQASFAMDDFLAVSSQQGFSMKGLASGVRAASNNISTFLTTINPLAGLAATLGIGVLTGVMTQIGGAAEKASDDTKKLVDELRTLRKENQTALIGSEAVAQLEKQEKAQELLTKAKKQDAAATVELAKAEENLKRAELRERLDTSGALSGESLAAASVSGSPRQAAKEAREAARSARSNKTRALSEVTTQQRIITESQQQAAFLKQNAGIISPAVSRVSELVSGGANKQDAISQVIQQSGIGPGDQSSRLREKLEDAAIPAERTREFERRKTLTPREQARADATSARSRAKEFKLEAQSDERETFLEKKAFGLLDSAAKKLESAALKLDRLASEQADNRVQN